MRNKEWKKYKLSDITYKLGDGLHGTPKYDNNGEYYFINGNNLENGKIVIKPDTKKVSFTEYQKYKKELNNNTILLSINGTLGNIGYYNNEKVILGKSACYFNLKDGFSKDYVRYIMSTKPFKLFLENFATGATIKNVSLDVMRNFEFYAPCKDLQDKIAKILSNYDNLIENNNKRIKILEEMAQKIYKEWFVDFKFPGHETTTFKDSPLGKIPNDWEVKLFSDYFDIQNGFAFKSKDYSNNGVKIIRTKDFASTKYINITDPIFLPNQLKSKYETYMLQEYDFLLIMVGASIGKYGIVLKKDMPSLQNQNMWALRPKNNYIYLKNYSIFMFENLIKKVLSFATGAAREFFRKEHFNNQRIIVPNSCVLNLFNQITNDILNEISNLYTKNENLKQTRDILLPRLISGEINVENMEIK